MKKLTVLFFLITFSIISIAQDKKLNKIKSYFEHKSYEKCISKSTDYFLKNPKIAAPYYYIAMSYYKMYDDQSDIKSVKEISKKIYKGRKKEGSAKYEELFKTEIDEFHKILKKYAYTYYQANKPKSRFYYDYLAKIYNDTLEQYDEIVLNIKEKPGDEIVKLTQSGDINQVDKNGLKQGKWTKVYSNGSTAYIAYFKNNKPIGELKRFHENGKLASFLKYDNEGEHATAIFYDDKGNKISEGKYNRKLKNDKWTYFKNGIKVKEENFKNDTLDGFQIIYFDNGQVYDKKKFKNGVQVGIWEKFYKNGQINMKSFLVNGLMHGAMIRYYKSGMTEVKGSYKNDLKDGIWTFYDEQGKVLDTIEYINGKDVNEEAVEKSESDAYKQNIMKSKTLLDPENFKNNPEDYPHK